MLAGCTRANSSYAGGTEALVRPPARFAQVETYQTLYDIQKKNVANNGGRGYSFDTAGAGGPRRVGGSYISRPSPRRGAQWALLTGQATAPPATHHYGATRTSLLYGGGHASVLHARSSVYISDHGTMNNEQFRKLMLASSGKPQAPKDGTSPPSVSPSGGSSFGSRHRANVSMTP